MEKPYGFVCIDDKTAKASAVRQLDFKGIAAEGQPLGKCDSCVRAGRIREIEGYKCLAVGTGQILLLV